MAKGLGAITSNLPADVRNFLERVREALGNGSDRLVTRSDLKSLGVIRASTGESIEPGEALQNGISCVTPPAPGNFSADGAMTSIILTWDGTGYSPQCHAHTKIYRSATPVFSAASVIRQETGEIFADPVGSDAVYYYWIRFVNIAGVEGPLHSIEPVRGETSPDIPYIMEMLTGELGIQPYFFSDGTLVINGITIPEGTWIKNAFILNGSIDNAKIGDAAIDRAKIKDLEVVEAKIAAGAVTNLKIGNRIESSDGGFSWSIDKNGSIQGRAITIRNPDGTVLLQSGGGLNWDNVVGINRPQDGADVTAENVAQAILNQGAFATLDQISGSNISTYIAAAAIGAAYIERLAVRQALIDDLTVTDGFIENLVVTDANIAEASIDFAKITNVQIQDAQIDSLNASKITGDIIERHVQDIGNTVRHSRDDTFASPTGVPTSIPDFLIESIDIPYQDHSRKVSVYGVRFYTWAGAHLFGGSWISVIPMTIKIKLQIKRQIFPGVFVTESNLEVGPTPSSQMPYSHIHSGHVFGASQERPSATFDQQNAQGAPYFTIPAERAAVITYTATPDFSSIQGFNISRVGYYVERFNGLRVIESWLDSGIDGISIN